MSRLNFNKRHGPDEFDDTAPTTAPSLEFDHAHQGGATPWPKGFGPGTITKAWKAGLIVVAEIDGFDKPVAVKEARWYESILEVLTLEGYRIPARLYTRASVAGLMSTGELVEE